MNKQKPRVLIGPMFADPAESVSAVNRAFVSGLSDRFEFLFSQADRQHDNTRQARFTGWNLWYFIRQALDWVRHLLQNRPEIAHYAVSSGWAMEKSLLLLAFARWSGAKTFGHLHSGGFLDHWAGLPGWRRRIAFGQLRKLDGFIVLSEWWREQIAEQVGLPRTMLWVVNNPIDPAFEEQALALPVDRAEGRILSLGTMGRDKGAHELVAACGILQRSGTAFHLDLVGPERDPGVRSRVEGELRAEACEELVSLADGVFGEAKLKLFRDTSIFVLPSYYENFPLVVLEAAAAGQAIITTPVGAVPEFFADGESAIFIGTFDYKGIASAVQYLIDNPGEQRRLGNAAREAFLSRLGRQRIYKSLLDAYAGCLTSEISPESQMSDSTNAKGLAIQTRLNSRFPAGPQVMGGSEQKI
jgi:glycosyltransferase involved in cell wall biosynthesis